MPNLQEDTTYLEYVAVMFCKVWLVPPHSTTLKFRWFVKDVWGMLPFLDSSTHESES